MLGYHQRVFASCGSSSFGQFAAGSNCLNEEILRGPKMLGFHRVFASPGSSSFSQFAAGSNCQEVRKCLDIIKWFLQVLEVLYSVNLSLGQIV